MEKIPLERNARTAFFNEKLGRYGKVTEVANGYLLMLNKENIGRGSLILRDLKQKYKISGAFTTTEIQFYLQ